MLDLQRNKDADQTTDLVPHDPFAIPVDPDNARMPKVALAYHLRVAGAEYAEIAVKLKYASEESCRQAVLNHIKSRYREEDIEEIVTLELERLDALQLIAWKQAREGNLKAVDTILKIMDQRAKYQGSYKSDSGSGGTTNNTAIFIGGDEQSYVEQLRKAREAVELTSG